MVHPVTIQEKLTTVVLVAAAVAAILGMYSIYKLSVFANLVVLHTNLTFYWCSHVHVCVCVCVARPVNMMGYWGWGGGGLKHPPHPPQTKKRSPHFSLH